jgi:outer membrane protein TolC
MRCLLPALAGLLLAACASPDGPARFAPVQTQTQALLGKDLQWARTPEQRTALDARVAELARAPLTAETAVQIALLNQRGLQAQFHALGIADAELVQASRLPNPGFTLAHLRSGADLEIDRGFGIDLLRLIQQVPARRLAELRLQQVQSETLLTVLESAARTRRAYWQALAAQQLLQYAQQVADAADAGAELAGRAAQAGNFSAQRKAREQAFAAEAALGLARAQSEATLTHEALRRELGLDSFTLPGHMPALPAVVRRIDAEALQQRVDVQAARQGAEAAAQALGLARVTGYINVLELGFERNSLSGLPTQRGLDLRLELPLFDWGQARDARAESVYRQALERAADTAWRAASEQRVALQRYQAAYAVARRYADDIVPLRRKIGEDNLLRYNGMLIGVFELMADAREQIASVQAAIAAQRDFFLAEGELDQSLLGPSPW